jgi:hypothetical protein
LAQAKSFDQYAVIDSLKFAHSSFFACSTMASKPSQSAVAIKKQSSSASLSDDADIKAESSQLAAVSPSNQSSRCSSPRPLKTEASAVSPQQDIEADHRALCSFGCTEDDRSLKDMRNVGTKAYPKWACKPCAASFHALSFQCRSGHGHDAEIARSLQYLRKHRSSEWNKLVVKMRVRQCDDEPGIGESAERQTTVVSEIRKVTQSSAVTHRLEYAWYTEAEFIEAEMKKGKSKEAATARWLQDKTTSTANNSRGEVMVPYEQPPRTFLDEKKILTASVVSQGTLNCDEQERAAMNRVETATSQSGVSSDLRSFGGDLFNLNDIRGMNRHVVQSISRGQAPAAASLMPPPPPAQRRKLRPTLSNPEGLWPHPVRSMEEGTIEAGTSGGQRKKRPSQAGSAVAVTALEEVREKLLKLKADTQQSLFLRNVNWAKLLKAFCKKYGDHTCSSADLETAETVLQYQDKWKK